MIILPLKTLRSLSNKVLEAFFITGQSSGWMISENFHDWVEYIFISHVTKIKRDLQQKHNKALLLVIIHSPKSNIVTLKLLVGNCIDVLILVSHLCYLL